MTRTDNIVEARDLTKVYGIGTTRVEALRGVELTVKAGESLGVMGQSGAGKSTLMHILGCLDRPTQGSYLLAGQDVSRLSDRDLSLIRATKIGFVFQTFNLIPRCSVFENVMMPFLYQNGNGSAAELTRRAERAIDRVGLTSRGSHKPSELSGGELQRAAIARAIVVEPLLVFADEPTGNLDLKTSEDILRLFRELNDEGTTLIVVTHSETVAARCKRVIRLEDGRITNDEMGS